MSRTDKDEPYWVTRATSSIVRHNHQRGVCLTETLEDVKAAKRHWAGYAFGNHMREGITCFLDHPDEGPRLWYGNPPHWFVTQRWHRPERARQRRVLRDAKRWRLDDLEDFDFENRQGRSSARREWWW